MKTVNSQHPWDRMPGEPTPSYRRFLFFRNYGPMRTVSKAFKLWKKQADPHFTASEDGKEERPHTWHNDCQSYKWEPRAAEYDFWILSTCGDDAMRTLAKCVSSVARKLLTSLKEMDIKPTSWPQVLDTLDALQKIVPDFVIQKEPVSPSNAESSGAQFENQQ